MIVQAYRAISGKRIQELPTQCPPRAVRTERKLLRLVLRMGGHAARRREQSDDAKRTYTSVPAYVSLSLEYRECNTRQWNMRPLHNCALCSRLLLLPLRGQIKRKSEFCNEAGSKTALAWDKKFPGVFLPLCTEVGKCTPGRENYSNATLMC